MLDFWVAFAVFTSVNALVSQCHRPFCSCFCSYGFFKEGPKPQPPKAHMVEEAKEDERDFVGALESGGPTQHRGTWARKDMPTPRLEALCACWHALIARAFTGSDTRG